MKSIAALALSLLATSISASPVIPTATIAFANDQSGAQGSATIPEDGSVQNIWSLYGSTKIAAGGAVVASSAQLTSFQANTNCVIKNANWVVVGTLTAEHTYLDLDGTSNSLVPLNLGGWTVSCTV
ncbi:hypothetical protein BO70DRAFT_398229 [Aspergillus heteromorphus CBS 117.55]|uniref:Uncharacterized protein n=1 Tax=Aspergillus heteromorphus CBS 117.55 TaxID=1448321 RepID=A0A317VR53_9EURO|nr:uncharacterized protein BO70DRAFT_398229 [Aspergillus heteromorphus CBS 117.55]PWY75372.1 hypothetical protein BO70DRAFT_398229 [Aspergillus heteromorphus CBS 117.55]